jgi:hypothetical protein
MSRDQPSAVLKATTRTLLILSLDDVADNRLAIHFVFIGLPIDAESAEVIENDARIKIERGNKGQAALKVHPRRDWQPRSGRFLERTPIMPGCDPSIPDLDGRSPYGSTPGIARSIR